MTLLRIAGVPVRFHPAFLALIGGWLVYTGLTDGGVAVGRWSAVIAIFVGSVLVHELGHVLAGRVHGISTRAIVLHPFGGAAELETARVPPRVDIVVSVAGPAANLLIAAPALVLAAWTRSELVAWLAAINVLLGTINLIPAFPMDGGRIFRAILVQRLGSDTGHRVALGVGVVFALALGVAGLALFELGLVLLAGFMMVLQWREHRVQQVLRQHPEWA